MNLNTEHQSQNVSDLIDAWSKEQIKLQHKMQEVANVSSLNYNDIKRVAGLDISFHPDPNNPTACVCIVILSFPELKVPYIPGYLAFREAPYLVPLLQKVQKECPELIPQVVLIDGNGVLHPRKFGVACHVGVLSGFPTIGVAKNFMTISPTQTRDTVKEECRKTLVKQGDFISILHDDGSEAGVALMNTKKGKNPVYVSVGYHIHLEVAVKLVITCSPYRIPEPIRQADLISREVVRDWQCKGS